MSQVLSKFGLTDKTEVLICFQREFVVQKKIQLEKETIFCYSFVRFL